MKATYHEASIPKLGVHVWEVLVIRIMVFGGLYWGFPYLGKLPYKGSGL